MELTKNKLIKEDGRYLIYYSFSEEKNKQYKGEKGEMEKRGNN